MTNALAHGSHSTPHHTYCSPEEFWKRRVCQDFTGCVDHILLERGEKGSLFLAISVYFLVQIKPPINTLIWYVRKNSEFKGFTLNQSRIYAVLVK